MHRRRRASACGRQRRGGGGRRLARRAGSLHVVRHLLGLWQGFGWLCTHLLCTAHLPTPPRTRCWCCRSTTYEPPSEDLLEALTELVKFATVADAGSKRQPAQGGAPWLPTAPLHTLLPPALAAQRGGGATAAVPHIAAGPAKLGAAAAPAAQALARRLYRFFRRAFTLWPEQRSIKPLLRCFLAYVAPWRTSSAAPMLLPGAAASAPGHSALASHLTAQMSDLVHRVHWADGGRGDAGRWA